MRPDCKQLGKTVRDRCCVWQESCSGVFTASDSPTRGEGAGISPAACTQDWFHPRRARRCKLKDSGLALSASAGLHPESPHGRSLPLSAHSRIKTSPEGDEVVHSSGLTVLGNTRLALSATSANPFRPPRAQTRPNEVGLGSRGPEKEPSAATRCYCAPSCTAATI